MADVQSNIHVNIDTSDALASLKLLQRQISAFHTQMAKSGTAASAVAANQAQNLMNSINATGQFQASMRTVTSSTESFTNALEKNKLTSREYFRYTGAATKTFGRLFRSEFETINKVARERVKDLQTQYIKMGRGANGALQAIAVRPLTLDMKNLGTQTAMAAQKQQLLNQLLKQGSTNLLNFGKNTQWAGRQLMVGFTVPLLMLGSQAAKTFMALEEQAIRFKRVYGELFTTQEETDAMVKDIQRLAKEYTKYGVAVEETMKMAADAAAMGKMGADLTAQVAQATRLAVLGGVEQAQALETTISVTNAFGIATEDLAKKIDFLNAVENQTVVSIEDLTIAMPKAGPVVQQLGGDVEDLAFFLTAMKEGGINASEGANALKSGLASLINPSEKASKFLGGLGVNIRGIVEANKGDIKNTVVGFAQALDTLDPLNRARAIEQLFGKFQFSRLSTLFQNVIGEGTQAARVLELTKATTEELAILSERELNRIENTTTYKFKKSIEDLKVTLAPVGEQFLKALTPIVEFAAKVLDKFNDLGDGSKKFITILTVALGAVGPIALMSFGLLANGLANIIKLFAGLKSVFNRAGSSTQVLGQQTSYLTQEQLEASAVAASLDQVHQRLRQTFTSEASAVNALALAYRNAISAQAGFTGPVRGGGMKGPPQSKKYSTGVTRVPGTGNQDTVPAMLTPGEAVIPAGAAQDPANKPLIARMVAGQRVQGFNTGTTEVTFDGKEHNAKSARQQRKIKDFIDSLIDNKDGTLSYVDKDSTKSRTFKKDSLSKQLAKYSGREPSELDLDKIKRGLVIGSGARGSKAGSSRPPWLIPLMEEAKEKNKVTILAEQDAIEKELKKRGITVDAKKMGNLFGIQASHLVEEFDADGNKIWRAANIAPEPGYINNYMNTIKKKLGQSLLKMTDAELKDKGIDREELKKLVRGEHPRTPEAAETFKNIAKHDIRTNPKKSGIYQAHVAEAGIGFRQNNGVYGAPIKSLADILPDNPRVRAELSRQAANPDEKFSPSQSEQLKKTADLAAKTKSGQLPPTNFGKLVSPTTGFSFPVPGVGGLYDGPNGKVFVKPMMSELDAIAEKRATDFAREVHGLDTPEQKVSTIIDPSDPEGKRKIIVLESKYDPKFANLPGFSNDGKEGRAQYFKQLVAANLRGDKDLKMGNLGGNILTDVGTAGVFDRATSTGKNGIRTLSEKMPSMYEMAERNLKGVAGPQAKNSPNWFANETQKYINDPKYTADQYDADMKKEIKRIQQNTEKFVAKMPLDDPLRPAYLDILRRVNEGAEVKNWRPLFDKHRSIAIRPNEVTVDEDGKTEKPKSQRRKSGTKTKNSDDTRTIPKSKESSVRNVTNIRGRADAPTIYNPNLVDRVEKQRIVKLAKYRAIQDAKYMDQFGTTSPNAIQKSIRRKNDANARQGLPLVGVRQEPVAPVDNVKAEVRERAAALKIAKEMNAAEARQANSRSMYGTEAPTASQRSIRKQNEKLQRQGKPLLGLTKEIAAPVSVFSRVLEKATKNVEKNTVASRALEKFRAKQATRAEAKASGKPKSGMGMTGGVMAASGVAMVASMVPGKVGEMAQKLMMPLMGLSMVLPLVQNKFGALAVGVGAVVAALAYSRMQFDKAQDSAFELSSAMGVGRDAMVELSKAAGKVSAGEQMDKRRSNKFSILPIQNGKSTFGQSFVKQDVGKAMIENIGKNGGATASVGATTAQLQNAVTSGSMSMDQAKSVAANLGEQLGDYTFGIKVIGGLTELLGPNGENLDKNPLEVRIKMIQDAQSRVNFASDSMTSAGNANKARKDNLLGVSDNIQAVGGVLAGAGAGAAAGAAVGTLGGPLAPLTVPLGALIGTVVGAIGGGIMGEVNRTKRIGIATGASVAQDKMAIEQGQEMIDSFDLQYQKKIELLKAQGKINEAVELENKYYKDRATLLAANKQTKDIILSNYKNSDGDVQKAYMTGTDKAITKKYKNTVYEDMVPLAQSSINDSGLNDEQKLNLKLEMESGNFDPNQMINLFKVFTDKTDQQVVLGMIGKFGGKFAAETISVVNGFGDDAKSKKEYLLQIKTKSNKQAQKFQDFYGQLAMYGNNIPVGISVDYFLKNPTAQLAVQGIIDKINAKNGKMDFDFVVNTLGAEGLAAVNADLAYWNTLDAASQKVYTTAIAYQLQLQGDADQQAAFKAWQAENKGKGPTEYINFAQVKAEAITRSSKDGTLPVVPASGGGGGGAKVQTSPLDELLKRLRDVRKNQIQVTEGWGKSQKALNKLFGGSKTIKIFSGIENDLRKIGAGEDLIDLITGMDPKEYEAKKKSLFKFDKGNIVGLKDNARSIQDAIASISLGEFVSDQEKMSKQIGNQTTALTRLKVAGVEGSVALEAVADATFAAAIANKKLSDEQIKKIVAAWNEAIKKKKTYAAITDIEQMDTELNEELEILKKMTELSSLLNQEQQDAVKDSEQLQRLLLSITNLKVGDSLYDAFLKLVNKTIVVKQTEVKVKQLKLTGLQDIFDKGFNAAMDKADVDEKTLQLRFEFETRDLDEKINLAQDEIAGFQYNIDDQEAMLRGIEKQEQKINDKYDERIEALDQVEKANAAISAQQKGQLTLAEALTSGDIAAAARAAQDMRAQAAADAVTKEKEALEKSREYEISQVRQDGKSRKDLEDEITRLQDLVYDKEEIIEKDQEDRRQKEVQLRKDLIPIDKRRYDWEKLQNEIDIERTSNEQFMDLMDEAKRIVEELKAEYRKLKKPVKAPIIPAGTTVCPAGTQDDGNGNCVPVGVNPGDPGCPPGQVPNSEGKCQKIEDGAEPPSLTYCPSKGYNVPTSGFPGNCPGAGPVAGSNGTAPTKKTVCGPGQKMGPNGTCVDDPGPGAGGNDGSKGFQPYYDGAKKEYDYWVDQSKLPGATPSNFGNQLATADRKVIDALDLVRKKQEYDDEVKRIAASKLTPTDFGPGLVARDAAVVNAAKKVIPPATGPSLADIAKKKRDEENLKKFGGNAAAANAFGNWNFSTGGIVPKMFALGGFAKGTDTVPAMLTPGEFIMSKYAVDSHGVDTMRAINNGQTTGGTVYNNTYALTVNAKTNANPNDIAQAVMSTIKRVDDRRIRGVSLNGR
jgi:TP901 family phage tail tape measure protein